MGQHEFNLDDKVEAIIDTETRKTAAGVVINVSTQHNFLKIRFNDSGLEQWHQAEWCKKI